MKFVIHGQTIHFALKQAFEFRLTKKKFIGMQRSRMKNHHCHIILLT